MYAKDFPINNGSQSEEVEDLTASLPYRSIAVLGLTFLVKSVNLRNLSRFVVPSYECDSIWKSVVLSISAGQ